MKPRSFTPEDLLGHARRSGVDRVVLIQISYYGLDNSYMLDAMERFPGTFSGVAVVDYSSHRLAEELEALARRGVRGFRIRPGTDRPDIWLDREDMRRLWGVCGDLNVAVCPLIDPDAIASLDVMCAAFPGTPVVIDHMARIGFGGPVREADVEALCGLARHPGVRVKVSAFYGFGEKTPPYHDVAGLVRRLLASYGSSRLMWASDCPFQVAEHRYEDSIAVIQDRLDFLSAADRERMLEGTAQEIFFA